MVRAGPGVRGHAVVSGKPVALLSVVRTGSGVQGRAVVPGIHRTG